MPVDRPTLRHELRTRRRAISADQQEQAAKSLKQRITDLDVFKESKTIALYLANDGEIDPKYITEVIWQANKQCFLPVLDLKGGGKMHFQRFVPETTLITNRFGIVEPAFNPDETISPEHLDLVLLPLTGFDEAGHRLGMGGGFYDRAFAFITETNKPVLVGLAHECQKVEQIPTEHWDIPVSGILTDQQYYLP